MAVACARLCSAGCALPRSREKLDEYARLELLVRKELEHVYERKRRLDLEFPNHAREFPRTYLEGIAKAMVLERLCAPPVGDGAVERPKGRRIEGDEPWE